MDLKFKKIKRSFKNIIKSVSQRIENINIAKYQEVRIRTPELTKMRYYHKGIDDFVYSDTNHRNSLFIFFKEFEMYSNGELMYSPCIKDKNGKDIYTYDIVSVDIERYPLGKHKYKSTHDKEYSLIGVFMYDQNKNKYYVNIDYKSLNNLRQPMGKEKNMRTYCKDFEEDIGKITNKLHKVTEQPELFRDEWVNE